MIPLACRQSTHYRGCANGRPDAARRSRVLGIDRGASAWPRGAPGQTVLGKTRERILPALLHGMGGCAGYRHAAPTLPPADPPITLLVPWRRGAGILVTVRKQALACGAGSRIGYVPGRSATQRGSEYEVTGSAHGIGRGNAVAGQGGGRYCVVQGVHRAVTIGAERAYGGQWNNIVFEKPCLIEVNVEIKLPSREAQAR